MPIKNIPIKINPVAEILTLTGLFVTLIVVIFLE